jgi:hypothetical protein
MKIYLRPKPTDICDLNLLSRLDLRPKPTACKASCDLNLPSLRPKPTAFLTTCDLNLPYRAVDNFIFRFKKDRFLPVAT